MKKRIRFISLLLAVFCLISFFSEIGIAGQREADDENIMAAEPLQPSPKANNDKLIALTFDDGPGKDTKRLLDGLRKLGAHCTFFVVGQYANIYPSTIKQCYEDGHQIASHSYTHPFLTSLSDSEIRSEMQKTNDAVNKAVGCKLTLMVRPPYGDYNTRVLDVLGVPAFYWSDDSGDWWSGATANSVYNNTMKTAGDGDILLLHDSHSWSVDAALRIVESLQAQGYEFVTVSELFRRRGVELLPGHIYSWLRANGTNLPGISKPKITTEPTPDGTKITMTSDPGTDIYYTLDGTVPNAASQKYTGSFCLLNQATITAVAGYDMNGSRSDRVQTTVPAMPATDTPIITISEDGTVTIEADGTAYYTVDNTEPTFDSAQYEEPFTIEPDSFIKVFAYSGKEGMARSKTVSLYYSAQGNVFDDISPDSWYTNAVDTAVSEGWMVGTAQYHFSPSLSVTRAQIVTVLYRLSGEETPEETSKFSDVPPDQWYTKAVIWAEKNGIVAGYDDGLFRPNTNVTREQTAAILLRYANYYGYDTSGRASINGFTDSNKVSGYAKDALSWAVDKGVFSGNTDNTLMPQSTLTRAQMASVITRFNDYSASWERIRMTQKELLALSSDVLALLAEKDWSAIEDCIHPDGLTFTPYSTVGETDRTIAKEDFAAAAESQEAVLWGNWDGSGDPLNLTFNAYWNRFVWNTDYQAADSATPNKITLSGNSIENVMEAYPDCMYVEYAVNSYLGYDDGTDWSTLKLVFVRVDDQWYLRAVIHGEWTT